MIPSSHRAAVIRTLVLVLGLFGTSARGAWAQGPTLVVTGTGAMTYDFSGSYYGDHLRTPFTISAAQPTVPSTYNMALTGTFAPSVATIHVQGNVAFGHTPFTSCPYSFCTWVYGADTTLQLWLQGVAGTDYAIDVVRTASMATATTDPIGGYSARAESRSVNTETGPTADTFTTFTTLLGTGSFTRSIPLSAGLGFRQTYCRARDSQGCLGDPIGYPGGGAATVDYTVTIVARPSNVTPLTLSCPPDDTGAVSVPYSSAFITTGGTGTVVASGIPTGSLPPGLTVSASGSVAGTPTATGVSSFTGRVTDSSGATATSPLCVITIAPPPLQPPGPPTNLVAGALGSTATLTWAAPTTGGPPTTYIVEAGSKPGANDIVPGFPTGGIATTLTQAGVPDGFYYVRVRASNAAGTSGPSNEDLLVVHATGVPGPPLQLTATATNDTVVLKWLMPSTGGQPTSYFVNAGTQPGVTDIPPVDTHSPATIYVATKVPAGTYYIHVNGANRFGVGPPSNEATVVVNGCVAPDRPIGLTILANHGTFRLAWFAPTSYVPDYYELDVGPAPGLTARTINVPATGATFALPGSAVPAGTYYGRLRALNPCGSSAPSNEIVLQVSRDCGDDRDLIIDEYRTRPEIGWVPSCSDFSTIGGNTAEGWTWDVLNGGWKADGNPHSVSRFGIIGPNVLSGLLATRVAYGSSINVTSGYRCPAGNQVAGGVYNSNHIFGYAIDMYGNGVSRQAWSTDPTEYDTLRRLAVSHGAVDANLPWTFYSDHHLHVAWK